MQQIINTRTNTIHIACDERGSDRAACGSLAHVPEAQVEVLSETELRADETGDRCGNCFADAGGY